MEHQFPSKVQWLPKDLMVFEKYTAPKGCWSCNHSYCHNPGAYITGLSCKLIKEWLRENEKNLSQKDDNGEWLHYTAVVQQYDICNKYE